MDQLSAIHWPDHYLPGTTDNFVSNEVIVPGLSTRDVWPHLIDTTQWPTYYDNVSDIRFPDGESPILAPGSQFRFSSFGLPPLDAQVVEYEPPAEDKPARLSWTAKQGGTSEPQLDVLHAWLLEDLPDGRVRILTQESQIGKPAAELASRKPNPMLNSHQSWLDGLARASRQAVGYSH